jgi:hypothetical protein
LACGSTDDASTAVDDIRAGEIDHEHAAVGMLVFATNGICTGTLIAPDVVLTAGHCVDEGKIPVAFYLGTGSAVKSIGSGESQAAMTRHEVETGEFVPGYVVTPSCPKEGLDVGLVKLKSKIEGVTPARIDARAPRTSETCTAVGFGKHLVGADQSTRGEKRRAEVKFAGELPGAFAFEDLTGGTEKGDSGGPLFCGDAIVAVNSCGNRPDRFARIDVAMPWIEHKLAAWGAPWNGGDIGSILPFDPNAPAPNDED